MKQSVRAIFVPQLDVNDVEMELVSWTVEHGASVASGSELCVLETAKATHDLCSEHSGVLYRVAGVHVTVRVGEVIAWVGESLAAVETHLASTAGSPDSEGAVENDSGTELRITAKARKLIDRHGLDAEAIERVGAVLKEKDVRRYLETSGDGGPAASAGTLPERIEQLVDREGALSRSVAAMARHLAETRRDLILATVETEVVLGRLPEGGEKCSEEHLLSTVVRTVAGLLGEFPLLKSFSHAGELIRYRASDIAVTMLDEDHASRLLAPVLRGADRLDVQQTSRRLAELRASIGAGELHEEEQLGACFTITMLEGLAVTRFTALQNRYQSAALAVGSPREVVISKDAGFESVQSVSLTLSYDHGLCDGFYAGGFLSRLEQALKSELD